MALDYGTIVEVKELMGDVTWGASYDAVLSKLLTRASRLIDDLVKKWPGYFYPASETRYFTGSGCPSLWVDELASVPTYIGVAETGVVDNMAGTGGTYTDYTSDAWFLWPDNAARWGKPYKRIDLDVLNGEKSVWYTFRRGVKITAPFGYSTTPPSEIKQATLIQSIRWFKRASQAYQDVGAIVDLGQLKFVKSLDPDIQLILTDGGYMAEGITI